MEANLRRLHASSASATARARARQLARACADPRHGQAVFLAGVGDRGGTGRSPVVHVACTVEQSGTDMTLTAPLPGPGGHLSRHALLATALAAGVTIALAGCPTAPEAPPDVPERGQRFDRAATFPVYLNPSAAEHTAAEIAAATPNGRTVVYSDSPGERMGFVDIT